MTDTETAPTPSSRPSRGASGGGLGLLWAWLPAIIRALRRRTRETVAEMRKVLWPSRNEMVTYTVVVNVPYRREDPTLFGGAHVAGGDDTPGNEPTGSEPTGAAGAA